MALDINIFYLLNNLALKNSIFDYLIIFLADYFQYFLIIAFISLLFFRAYPKRQRIKIALTVFSSMIVARSVIVSLVRYFYHRARPFTDHSVSQLITNNNFSFPSGHAALFFAMAMAIYLYDKKLGIWFFIAAILMGLSRIVAGVHYPSDIIGGAAIGILTSYLIFLAVEKINGKIRI